MLLNGAFHSLTHLMYGWSLKYTSSSISVFVTKHFKNWCDRIFADRVHVRNHWILVQALAHTPVPNYDIP